MKKKQIPRYYIKKYQVKTLFRVELPHSWRLIYAMTTENYERRVLLLEVFDHKKYNRRFGYH